MQVKATPTTYHRTKFLGVTPRTKEVRLILVISAKMDPVFFCTKKTGPESIAHTPLKPLVESPRPNL